MSRGLKRPVVFVPPLAVVFVVSVANGVYPSVGRSFELFFRDTTTPLTARDTTAGYLMSPSASAEQIRNHLTESDKLAISRLDKVEQMPRTGYPEYQPIPTGDKNWSEAWDVHDLAWKHFANSSGFGAFRMRYSVNERGESKAHAAIDRVELVGLLTSSEPGAYVIDDMATPRIAKVAKRRTLDAFESAALDAIQRGKNLVYSPIVPTRMFGAIRARAECLRCHSDKREGDLLGGFTYWLKLPADQIRPPRELKSTSSAVSRGRAPASEK